MKGITCLFPTEREEEKENRCNNLQLCVTVDKVYARMVSMIFLRVVSSGLLAHYPDVLGGSIIVNNNNNLYGCIVLPQGLTHIYIHIYSFANCRYACSL